LGIRKLLLPPCPAASRVTVCSPIVVTDLSTDMVKNGAAARSYLH